MKKSFFLALAVAVLLAFGATMAAAGSGGWYCDRCGQITYRGTWVDGTRCPGCGDELNPENWRADSGQPADIVDDTGSKEEDADHTPTRTRTRTRTRTYQPTKTYGTPAHGGGETSPGYGRSPGETRGHGGRKSAPTGQGVKKAFTDSDGTGWNYCRGKCTKKVKKHTRAGGGTDHSIHVTNVSCPEPCSCVLFKNEGGKLIKKLSVDEDDEKGHVNIGQDNHKDYSVRCVEED